MNKTVKSAALAAVFANSVSLLLADVPEVVSASMAQDSSRMVTITYELTGGPAVVTMDIQTNATGDVWASIGGKNIQRVTGDCWKKVSGDGTHTIRWRPDLDWPDHVIGLDQGGVRAVVTAWALDNTPDYMVVDITQGATANTPRYYPSVDFLPGGLLGNDAYRTTSLVMRKVLAKDVTWTMGSVSEPGRNAANEKAHQATLDRSYYIGVFPVTQAQWYGVTGYNNSKFSLIAAKTMRPVENVSYNQVRMIGETGTISTDNLWPRDPFSGSFLGILRSRTGIDFDLPSEAQWEFAARAGHGEGKWGDGSAITSDNLDKNLPGRYLHNGGNIGTKTEEVCTADAGTPVVGSYAPNSWGIYDMHGCTFEWCNDWFVADVSGIAGAVNVNPSDPTKLLTNTSTAGSYRVRRGGSYRHAAQYCRAASRLGENPASVANNYGFRVVCTAGLK